MAILWGDTGKAAYGTLKTFNFTYPTPYESYHSTPLSVPNVASLPGTPIESYTIKSTDFPTISPGFNSVHFTGILIVAGKNTDTTAKTVNYQINKNGSSVLASSFSSTNGQFYTQTIYKFMDIAVNDVIDIYLYCSSSALINYDYMAFFIVPTQIFLTKGNIIKDTSFTIAASATLSATGTTPTVANTANWYVYPSSNISATSYALQMSANVTGLTFNPQITSYGFGRAQYGDLSGPGNGIYNVLNQHATNRPLYNRDYVPTQITFREILR